jgi:hypothetical protein
MANTEEQVEAGKIAQDLNKGFFAHGDAVSRSRALELRLRIADRDKNLEGLMWTAYRGIEDYMELRHPFNPLSVYLANTSASQTLNPTAAIQFPPNAPAQLIENVWNAWAQQALQQAKISGIEVPFSVVNAIIESSRLASEYRSEGKIFAYRDAGAQVQVSVTVTESGWKRVQLAHEG